MGKYVKCEGQAYIKTGDTNSLDYYEAEFVLADSVPSKGHARSILQDGYIDAYLRSNLAGYVKWRTCQVTSFEDSDEPSPSPELDELMVKANRFQLLNTVVRINEYGSVKSQIKAVTDAVNTFLAKRKDKAIRTARANGDNAAVEHFESQPLEAFEDEAATSPAPSKQGRLSTYID